MFVGCSENITLSCMNLEILAVVNEVRENKLLPPLSQLAASDRLREDLGFNSLDLAELSVRIEERFGKDVFAEEIVTNVGEICAKLGTAPEA